MTSPQNLCFDYEEQEAVYVNDFFFRICDLNKTKQKNQNVTKWLFSQLFQTYFQALFIYHPLSVLHTNITDKMHREDMLEGRGCCFGLVFYQAKQTIHMNIGQRVFMAAQPKKCCRERE